MVPIQAFNGKPTKNSLDVVDSILKSQFHPCITRNQDIVKGLQDYYSWGNLTLQEFIENEDLLLQILSYYLQRKIIFHPILKPVYFFEESKIFGDSFKDVFHIFGCRKALESFYISATPRCCCCCYTTNN